MNSSAHQSRTLLETFPLRTRISPARQSSVDESCSPGGPASIPKLPVQKQVTSLWRNTRNVKNDGDGTRGPIGLRLLHASPEPLIDLVFVHGLRGGSTKTWRKGNDPRMFWPQLWLPMESGLRNVSVHSFGYDSDWASTKRSILDVHDFGRSLLEEMRNSPHLRKNPSGPIILLGHSMGGLVIKKAFILAKDVPDFQDRIKCIFFLATPHRGSDYAAILNKILALSGLMSSRPYITDLTTGSTSAKLINDDFGKFAGELPIFSFYETLGMNLGVSSGLIVERHSAILGSGFKNERVQLLNANHRDICKFDSPDDPNYITLKNTICSAVEDLLKDVSRAEIERSKAQMQILESYLGVSNRPHEYFPVVDGSCLWIDARDDFQVWRDTPEASPENGQMHPTEPSIFWVYANPGTGKTYLAAHVAAELQDFQLNCACYYFHAGGESSSSLAHALRSIAYQMATLNVDVRQKMISLHEEHSLFDPDDARMIWRSVFSKGIFRSEVHTPQYWVIDALDECGKYQELFKLIRNEKPSFPLRIFITSRKVPDMDRLCRLLEGSAILTCIEIPIENSLYDIECYIHARIDELPIDTIDDRQDITQMILDRSKACFLWARLVLDELEQVYSKESVIKILQSIPEGMVSYYERITRTMGEKKFEKHITQAVLLWATASSRDLSISELTQALRLDIDIVLPNMRSAIEGLCGQLVYVDPGSGLVILTHPTVREFLLSDAAGEFRISEPQAHKRVALVCLQLLFSAEMKPPRGRRLLSSKVPSKEPSPLLDYAMTQFSEHVYGSSAEDGELLSAIGRFLQMNVLSWIEKNAQKGDLHCLIRTSKNLKAYVDRRVKSRSTSDREVRNICNWAADLSRIVTKFGEPLLRDPSSIYFIIPPLCPSTSIIHQQFGKRPDGLEVVGYRAQTWDDCVASVNFKSDSMPGTIACGENAIAVGMLSGDVILYNHRSCEKTGMICQKDPVDMVHLADKYLATATIRSVVVHDMKGSIVWEYRMDSACILLFSSADSLVAVTEYGHLLKWELSNGALLEDRKFTYQSHDDENADLCQFGGKPPFLASISPDMEIISLGYMGGTVCLWDIPTGELIGWALDEENKLRSVLLFNPNPNINLLLVIYTNHDMSLYDTWSGSLVKSYKYTFMGILSASCSPDGRTLATADTRGNLRIWDFESLSLLYRVLSPASSLRLLSFTSDGLSVVDATHYDMRIWSPAVLVRKNVRKNVDEDQSPVDGVLQLATIEGQYEALRKSRITALCAHPSLAFVFAGKYTGQVIAFNTQTGQQVSVLYSHSPSDFVTQIAVSEKDYIASSDADCVLQVWKLATSQPAIPTCDFLLLRASLSAPIRQLCFSTDGAFLLVSTAQSDSVYSMQDGSCIGSMSFDYHERHAWRWVQGPGHDGEREFILVCDRILKRYSAKAFPSTLYSTDIALEYNLAVGDVETGIRSAFIHPEYQVLVLEVHYNSGYLSSSTVFLFDLKNSLNDGETTALRPLNDLLPRYSKHFIGVNHRTKAFVFLHMDSWLCSIDMESITERRFSRHFFVPNEYIPLSHQVLPVKSADDNVVFCLHGEVTIIKNGFRFREIQNME
ncbi:NACHT and WD domain protein [Hypoxylon sp. FL0543]|nr:NACHT and WD domain protein [Hypoxylon sp. FL0543]